MRKVYTIEVTETKEGVHSKVHIHRTAENLSAIEILGLLEHAQFEIMQQMKGVLKSDITTREVIINETKTTI